MTEQEQIEYVKMCYNDYESGYINFEMMCHLLKVADISDELATLTVENLLKGGKSD